MNPGNPRFYLSHFKDTMDSQPFYFDKKINDFVIDRYKIASIELNKVHNVLAKNLTMRADYYRSFEGWEVELKELPEDYLDMKQYKDKVKRKEEIRKRTVEHILEKYNKETITAYSLYVDKKFLKDNSYYISELLLENAKYFYRDNKQTLHSKTCSEAIKSYVRFYKLGLPHNLIIEFLKLSTKDREKTYKRILWLFTAKAVLTYPEVLAYDKKDGISIKRAAIIKWILENILPLNELSTILLLESYNEMLATIGMRKESQRRMTENIMELINMESFTKRIGKSVVRFYRNLVLHNAESILKPLNLDSSEFIREIETAAQSWFRHKLSALENAFKQNGLDLPSHLQTLITTQKANVTQKRLNIIYINKAAMLHKPKDIQKAHADWPFRTQSLAVAA